MSNALLSVFDGYITMRRKKFVFLQKGITTIQRKSIQITETVDSNSKSINNDVE
jgi:hypothetical protein